MHASHNAHQRTIPFLTGRSIGTQTTLRTQYVRLQAQQHLQRRIWCSEALLLDRKNLQTTQRRHQLSWHRFRTACRCGAAEAQLTGRQSPSNRSVPDFELIKIPGNGSCMFQALAQGHHLLTHGKLLSEHELHREGFSLRRAICFLLEKHREEVQPFVPGDYSAYISYMATDGVWGGEPELAMAVRSLRRPILVYNTTKSGMFGSDLRKAAEYGTDSFTNVPPVCLLFYGHHYDLLRAKA